MSDQRSNKDEFLSFLGTCMTFYNMHLTPYEQDHIMVEMGKILHDHIAPKNYSKLMKYVYGEKSPAYMDTDSIKDMYPESLFNTTDVNAVREAYHTGQTRAVMRDYKDFRDDPDLRGGETDGDNQI